MTEMETIKQALGMASLPSYVKDCKYRLDTDSSGDPAVWIWVIMTDTEVESPSFPSDRHSVKKSVVKLLRESGIERWPYVRFRSESEQNALSREQQQ